MISCYFIAHKISFSPGFPSLLHSHHFQNAVDVRYEKPYTLMNPKWYNLEFGITHSSMLSMISFFLSFFDYCSYYRRKGTKLIKQTKVLSIYLPTARFYCNFLFL